MKQIIDNTLNNKQWNRQVINIFWITALLITIFETLNMIYAENISYYIIHKIILPTFFLILSCTIIELLYHYKNNYIEYSIILLSITYPNILAYFHSDINTISGGYFISNILITTYLNKKIALITSILNITSYILMYLLNYNFYIMYTPKEISTLVFTLITETYICLTVIDRGIVVNRALIESEAHSRELIIRNTLIDKLTKIDALTDLYNHITFHEYLDKIIEYSDPEQSKFFLAILDIDNFKKINDTYGHRSGDIVLKNVANLIKQKISPNDFAARYGGEEFAILFSELDRDTCYYKVENIRKSISELRIEEINNQCVTISIGLNEYSNQSKEKFFVDTDKALYVAKNQGKNQTVMVNYCKYSK